MNQRPLSRAALRALSVLALCALPCAASAQEKRDYDPAPPGSGVAAVLNAAEKECVADDPEAPARLDVAPWAVTWADLDGDEESDDAIVDFNAVTCTVNGSMWHGTGGAPVHLLLDATAAGGVSAVYQGWGPQVIRFQNGPLVLLALPGTYCDATGSGPCPLAINRPAEAPRILTASADEAAE